MYGKSGAGSLAKGPALFCLQVMKPVSPLIA
jgi:hypothetical protein